MVFSAKICAERRARVKVLKEHTSLSVSEIARKCNISRSSIYRMLKQMTNRKKTKSSGRPRKISEKDKRHNARTLIQRRKAEGTVSCSRVMSESGVDLSKFFGLDSTACTKSVRLLLSCGTKERFVVCKRFGTEIRVCKTNGQDKTRVFLDEGRVLLSRRCKFCPQV